MKRPIFTGLAILLFPFISYASWWNPLTWSKQEAYVQPSVPDHSAAPVIESPTAPEPVQECVPVTNTVTVEDPAQAKTISDLKQQVADLKSQLSAAQHVTVTMSSSHDSLPPAIPIAPTVMVIQTNDAKVKSLKSEIVTIQNLIDDIDTYGTSTSLVDQQNFMNELNSSAKSDGTKLFTMEAFLPNIVSFDDKGDFLENLSLKDIALIRSVAFKYLGTLNKQLDIAEANQ